MAAGGFPDQRMSIREAASGNISALQRSPDRSP
jgi:hypothetical protein